MCQDGTRLRIKGEGDAGQRGGPAGDLYVFVSVEADKEFRREGLDLLTDLKIDYLGQCQQHHHHKTGRQAGRQARQGGGLTTGGGVCLCGCWFVDAILGSKKKVSTVDGDVEVEVAAGTQPNAKIRLDVRSTHPPTRQTGRVRGV